MHNKTIAELSAGLSAGEFSSVELTEACIQRISTLAGRSNCFITQTPERALEDAKHADQRRATGDFGPLTGIPIAHKDIFCTQGIRSSCASKMLDSFVSPYESTVSAKLKAAGTVLLGKTNMDEFAMGSSNETSFYGPVRNPWNHDVVPGGSSGGSAACVAARLASAATGTDTGGSIRQPAALCGITGLKPTYGRVSRYGMIAFASSLDQAGPMTRTAQDAAMMLQAMAGFDERDSTSVDVGVPDYSANLADSIDGLTIGLPREYFAEGLDSGVGDVLEQALETLRKLGATTVDIDLPNTSLAVPAYYVVAPAECSSNLSRMDGVRFGYRCEDPVDLEDLYKRSRGEGFGEEVKRRIMIGTYALSAGYYDAYYLKAQRVRRLISDDFTRAFDQVDVIMGPTAPSVAFALGSKTDDPIGMYLSDIYTIAVNLAGLPAMSVPCGFADELPVGLQIIGKPFEESRLLNVAHQFQQATDWHQRAPQEYL
ncbi:MAG TPA: Asp-tRNA(Asn)/Glu-tRNA(Gln) amidotransferase subunit GatA [Chromatiaceae bacterium]|jgi:aspartyl-tRNA(Asn)/glutamyl-tRNA(Gln) amidotransferase subunit A|nr:Asp-tRNA(Asn)/Glu-tRNA(Gln) amidotransferase subunit GatA [Chromatiaceae bacterium]HIA07759.1 Asp-tRNA(Asn)/Glu-tRNA(Gln) amidotransferase subunit GatA [Chromatiaceae bacterium]HIN81689.1 Asp-tRNA(Asn)/Glu-tRNA(Gln) amidotransferase subunit GatA [Chromatiales bacterium]HIO55243.1 Asp-tRNA(Asn)/Glu-tRNA(Gln) amidotransferase subunit GatA [Chromatiales bacterium]